MNTPTSNKHTELPWFKLYANNFLVRTAALGAEGKGAYITLLCHYWDVGGALPNNPNFLRKICDLSKYRWGKIGPSILNYFRVEGDKLYHDEMEQLLQEARHNRENKVKAGQASGRARNQPPLESVEKETNTCSEHPSFTSSSNSSFNNSVTSNSVKEDNSVIRNSVTNGDCGQRIGATAYRLAEYFSHEASEAWPDLDIPELDDWAKGMEEILREWDEELLHEALLDPGEEPQDLDEGRYWNEQRLAAVLEFYFEEYRDRHYRDITSPAILKEDFDELDYAESEDRNTRGNWIHD